MLTVSLCLAVLVPQGYQPPTVNHVVINEFSYDDSGLDDREFVELYNPTASSVDISGWLLDAEDAVSTNPTYLIPGTAGSSTTVIAPGGLSRENPRGTKGARQLGSHRTRRRCLWRNEQIGDCDGASSEDARPRRGACPASGAQSAC